MGVRSDVGIAIKNEVYDQLSIRTKLFIKQHFSQEAHHEEATGGRLFHCSDIKWYVGGDNEIDRLYKELDKIDDDGEGYLILEGCYEHPESDEGTAGNWWGNPWDLFRNVHVSVDYHIS